MTPFIRTVFKTISVVSPLLAGNAAYRLFTTPLKTGRLSPAEKRLEALSIGGHVILLASPNQLSMVTAGFSKTLGISEKAQQPIQRQLPNGNNCEVLINCAAISPQTN